MVRGEDVRHVRTHPPPTVIRKVWRVVRHG